ncbi:resolvase domain-containing protein [Calothrix sp. NIES-4071]|nr:resolvase domain-containing protein [Calothrix sp. NIES-4071]BAZ57669.1 resolvase domain-containing protein [Calothrix sp. NIES-4105]
MRVGYARVSTGEQDDALTQQIARLEKAGVCKIFSDIKSGKSNNRQNFNKLLTLCRQGKITEIVVTRLDRLARSVVTISKAITLFEEQHIKLIILDAPIEDISNPFSKFSINQMGALAQFESDLLQSRVIHGYNYFREQNKASPHTPFGYRRDSEKYVPDLTLHESGKSNWVIAREIIDWFLSNQSTIRGTIHHVYEVYKIRFSTTGLTNWLKNPTLRGHTCYNRKFNNSRPELWDVRKDTHTPLIDEGIYRDIETLLSENRRRWGRNLKGETGKGFLSGLVYCGCCGGKCYVRRNKNLLACKQRAEYGETYCTNKKSTSLTFICESLDRALTEHANRLREYALSEEPVESPLVIELRATLANLQKLPKNDAIDDAIAKIKIQIMQHQKVAYPSELIDEWVNTFSNVQFFKLMPEQEKAELYRKFVRSVTILSGDITDIKLVDII